MIKEDALKAAHFWRAIDESCSMRSGEDDLHRASLVAFYYHERRNLIERGIPWEKVDHALRHEKTNTFKRSWSEFMATLGSALDAPTHDHPGHRINREFLVRFGDIYQSFWNDDDSAEGYDQRFLALAKRHYRTDLRSSHFNAVLSNSLAGRDATLIDAFCQTGELFAPHGVERLRRHRRGDNLAIMLQSPSTLALELRMRLGLYRIELLSPPDLHDSDDDRLLSRSFVQIEALRSASMRSLSRNRFTDEDGLSTATTALEMLAALWARYRGFAGVTVVPGADRTRGGEARYLRREFTESGRLLAVIDLPEIAGSTSRAARSAWILPERENTRREVLMLDLRALGKARTREECGMLAEFATKLVRLWENGDHSPRWVTHYRQPEADRIRDIFDREFRSGYRDVEGLCQVVGLNKLHDAEWALAAQRYLRPPRYASFLSGIDGTPIVERLSPRRGHGQVIYVIGNNGEGKSLLLRELVYIGCAQERKTIGISFGTTDRFPFGQPDPQLRLFCYEGARTTASGASNRRLANDVLRKMWDIHCDEARLAIFTETLHVLDFESKRYIVPMETQRHAADHFAAEGESRELSDSATNNLAMSSDVTLSRMQAGFIRHGAKRGITPFTELSSGEQQVLSLLVRFIATAERDCLVLIDEPESSLHVGWQRLLPTLFRDLATQFQCDAVIATHSPLIISSTLAPVDQCLVMRRRQLLPIESRDLQSVENVLFTGFETHTENNRSVRERCAAIVAEGIRIANLPRTQTLQLERLGRELSAMRGVVLRSRKRVDSLRDDGSLELIDKAREAIAQIQSWQSNGNHDGSLAV